MSRPCSAGSPAAPRTRGTAPGSRARSTRPSTRSGPTPCPPRPRPSAGEPTTHATGDVVAGYAIRDRPRRTEPRRRSCAQRSSGSRSSSPISHPSRASSSSCAHSAADGCHVADHHRGPRRTGRTAARHRRDRDPRLTRRRGPHPLPSRRRDAPRAHTHRRPPSESPPLIHPSSGRPRRAVRPARRRLRGPLGQGDPARQPRAAPRLPRRDRARALARTRAARPSRTRHRLARHTATGDADRVARGRPAPLATTTDLTRRRPAPRSPAGAPCHEVGAIVARAAGPSRSGPSRLLGLPTARGPSLDCPSVTRSAPPKS